MTPRLAAEQREKLAAEFSTMSQRYGELESAMALKWLEMKQVYPDATNKEIDMRLAASEEGREYAKLKYMLKAYEKQISAYKSMIDVANSEARNNY